MPTQFNQTLKFGSRKEETISEFQFVGGLNKDVHETKLEANQSPNMANVVFNDTASIKTRNGQLRYNTDPIGAVADESNTGASTGTITLDAPGDYVAQTFQVGTGADFIQVDFYLEMNTTGESQYVKAELWSAGPGSILVDGQIKLISVDTETAHNFRFRTPRTLTATTEYAVVLRPFIRGSTQTVNSVLVHHTGNAYASGGAYTSTDSGLNWSAVASTDLKFVVYTGGSTGVTGLTRYYSTTGIQQQIAKVGSSIYRGNDGTGAMTAITLPTGVAFNSANFIDYTIVNDTLLVVDKDTQIKKYRGSTNANYSTGTITATLDSATVTGSGTSWNTTTNAEVGEYIQLPDGKWYKITAIASNTSLTIETAYKASTSAGASYIISPWGEVQGKLNSATAPASLVVPTPDYIENHSNRVWTLEGNTLRWSVLDTSVSEENFNDFDTSNNSGALIVPAGKGDTGTGLYSLGNALYVFQNRAIWGLYGTSPANFELRNITNEVGMIDKKTLVEFNDVLMFLSAAGIIMFDGSNVKNVSEGVVNTFIRTWANNTSPVATLWENKYLIAYTPAGGSSNSEALYYDFLKNKFGRVTEIYANVFSRWIGGTDHGEIYMGASNRGDILRWDVGGHDDGYEIYTLYDTGSLGYEAGINDKSAKKFYIQQLALGDWDMTVTQFINISETETLGTAINLSPGSSSLWDVAQWGVDTFSSEGALITTRVAEFQGIGKYFKFRIEQTGYDEGIEVLGIVATSRMRRLQ